MSEIVYVLQNPAMPDYIKIGRSTQTNLENRIRVLSNRTAVPERFVLLAAVVVEDAPKIEKLFHRAFAQFRARGSEFFKIPSQPVTTLLEAFGTDVSDSIQEEFDESTTPEERLTQQAYVAEISERRSILRFNELCIQPGAVLAFKNDPTKTCRVVDDRKVEYNGEITSLSALALMLLREGGKNPACAVNGNLYFTYEDECHGVELLTDRRDRLENEEEA